MKRQLIPLLLISALSVSHCAPFGDNGDIDLNPKPKAPIDSDQDSTPQGASGTHTDEEDPMRGSDCPKGAITPTFPFEIHALTEAELRDIEKLVPLDTEKYPLVTAGIGNNKAGLKQTPYSSNKQIAYSIDLSDYSPSTRGTIRHMKLFFGKMRKYSQKKNEFICFLETGKCSGSISRKARKHLRPEWQDEITDESFSDIYFKEVGTWKAISLGRGHIVYENLNLFYKLYDSTSKNESKKPALIPDDLGHKKLTFVLGTQSYFDPADGARLLLNSKFCRE